MAKLLNIRTYTIKRDGSSQDEGRGALSIIEQNKDIPFEIKRVYYIHGSKGIERGGHRHKKTISALICVAGEFNVRINDGIKEEVVLLDSADKCLILEPKDWHSMTAKDEKSVLLVLASEHYDASDYIDEKYPEVIDYENLYKVNKPFFEDYLVSVENTLNSGWYVLGENVKAFEEEFGSFLQTNYCVGVGSGLDALELSLAALDLPKGSEVIVPSNAYIATIVAIEHLGLVPVLVEPDIQTYNIDPKKIVEKITSKTKVIMPVHLYGKPCKMDEICEIALKHNLTIIEDCAQAHGAEYQGKKVGTFGGFGAFSFYPTKNLGAIGEAGLIVCPNEEMYHKIKALRNYGSHTKYQNKYIGYNSRLDELQAGLLRVKLKKLEQINNHKKKLARAYDSNISNPLITKPIFEPNGEDVFHIYPIRCQRRDELKKYLQDKGIKTEVHYPIPPHMQEATAMTLGGLSFPISEEIHRTILSLPISTFHTEEDVHFISRVINEFK